MKKLALAFLILAAPIVLFGWLLMRSLVPGGELTVSLEAGGRSPFINRLLPDERVTGPHRSDRGTYVSLIDEPAYFTVEPPRSDFTQATVKIAFDQHKQPIVELGALGDLQLQTFDFRPLSNAFFEETDWHKLVATSQNLGVVAYSKEPVRGTLEDFLTFPPARAAVATYRAEFPEPYRSPDYVPLGRTQRFDFSLRGAHEFVTYVKNETVNFHILYTDVNRTAGADEGAVRVWNEHGEVVTEKRFSDDGNTSTDQTFSSRITLSIVGSDWPEGVYRVELSGTSDIIWRRIDTTLRYVTFKNSLYIADEVGYGSERSTSFVTNAKHLTAQTFHSDSSKEIVLQSGDREQRIHLPRTHEKVQTAVSLPGVVLGYTAVGDVKLTGVGKFALSRESFFDPDPVTLTAYTDLEASDVDYLYGTMAPVIVEGGWRVAEATFDLAKLPLLEGAYTLAISAPGIKDSSTTVDIHAVEVMFSKPPMPLSGIVNHLRDWLADLLPWYAD